MRLYPQKRQVEELKEKKMWFLWSAIIIGDLNANDVSRGNKQLVERLKTYGYVDVWVQKGNPDDTVTEAKYRGRLDYAIASEAVYASISNMEIDPMPMDCGMTDHAAVIIDVF